LPRGNTVQALDCLTANLVEGKPKTDSESECATSTVMQSLQINLKLEEIHKTFLQNFITEY